MNRTSRWAAVLILGAAVALPAFAVVQQNQRAADSVQFRAAELTITGAVQRASDLAAFAADPRLLELGVAADKAYVDVQTGRFSALLMGTPLLPGRGLGNRLTWNALGAAQPKSAKELEAAATVAFRAYLENHAEALGLDLSQLAGAGKVAAVNDDFVHIYIPRVVGGVPVRGNSLVATIKYGNLILLGLENWGDLDRSAAPTISAREASAALRRHVGADLFGSSWKGSELVWVPLQAAQGLEYRLAWIVRNDLGSEGGRFEALVDAGNGEVFEIQDATQWVATPRRISGGVYPVSNDATPPDGTEQTAWPMPYSNVTTPSGVVTTDIGGNLPLCVDGSITATFSGPYVNMADVCGADSLAGTGDIDWLSGPLAASTDCTTPGVGGAGNTKASRSGFHELNMLTAMARSHISGNSWLAAPLTANMNINNQCNANWNGSQVNFYRSGGGCRNTGEIAAIFDHEWGHGMDSNDNVPGGASPGEAIADTYAALRLNTSCIGRGFFQSGNNCNGGYGDACTSCSGVRDIDFAKHVGNTPALIGGRGSGGVNSCPISGTLGPCGREIHCEGYAPGQSVWDLWNRKLTGAPYSFSVDKAREIGTQLTFRGAINQTAWYGSCATTGNDACGAGSGYRSYLAADDDDGNLVNGTPHWVAIDAAFNDHKVGCDTDAPVDFGCSGTPVAAPTVTATARDKGVDLSWAAIGGAQGYRVYRTDGVFSCDFGKILVAELGAGATSYGDRGLQNGRPYSYQVIPMGSADECFGTPSSCSSATPTGTGGGVTLIPSLATITTPGGDGDPFLDNCETVTVTVPVSNTGTTTLTNLRVVAASSPSHPATTVFTPLPAVISPSFAVCSTANASASMQMQGVAQGDVVTVRLEVTANEFAGGVEVFEGTVQRDTEGDFQFQATKTWSFAADADGWSVTSGTFNRTNTGTYFPSPDNNSFWQSSTNLNSQCDVIESPVLRLSATSTMTLSTNFSTETNDGQWWDRANIGLVNSSSGARTVLVPSSGRPYQASGVNGVCGTTGQVGWAGLQNTWAASNWSSAALASQANIAGRLEIRYGTDELVFGDGFRWDGLTLTNFDIVAADAQSNTCISPIVFIDGFNAGNTSAWSSVVP